MLVMETEETQTPIEYIDGAMAALPDLTQYGIEETDRGVCESTYENRRALRAAKMTWVAVYNENGEPTNKIQAVTEQMRSDMSRLALADRKTILKDDRDPNSDYITGLALILSDDAEELVPAWVIATTRKWNDIKDERDRRKADGNTKPYRPNLVSPPGRCQYIKIDGVRCQYWHGGLMTHNSFCRVHLSKMHNPEVNPIEHTRNRLRFTATAAAEVLEELMDTATSEQVRLKASTEILDRAGVRGGTEIEHKGEIEVKPAGEIVRERIERLKQGAIEREKQMAAHTAPEPEAEYVEVVEDDADTEE